MTNSISLRKVCIAILLPAVTVLLWYCVVSTVLVIANVASNFVLVPVVVLVFSFAVFFTMGLYFELRVWIHNRTNRNSEIAVDHRDNNNGHKSRAKISFIDELFARQYVGVIPEECPICLQDTDEDHLNVICNVTKTTGHVNVVLMQRTLVTCPQCCNVMHCDCLCKSLVRKPLCPMCRYDFG